MLDLEPSCLECCDELHELGNVFCRRCILSALFCKQLNKQTGAVGVLDVVGFGVVGHDSLSLMNVGAPRPHITLCPATRGGRKIHG